MLIYEIPGQFRIVYVHGDSAGTRGFHGDTTRGVVPIWQLASNHEDASKILTPVYVQYRSPQWRMELSWKHVPMSLDLFQAFLTASAEDQGVLERSGRRFGIDEGLLTTLQAAPRDVLSQRLSEAIAEAIAPSRWKALHGADPETNQPVWACVYVDYVNPPEYDVCRLVYSGDAWFHETGELAVAPDYFAEIAAADATASVEDSLAPTPPPIRVFPWRPWV